MRASTCALLAAAALGCQEHTPLPLDGDPGPSGSLADAFGLGPETRVARHTPPIEPATAHGQVADLAQYRFEATPDGAFVVHNPVHGIRVRFDATGLTATDPDEPWFVRWKPLRWGRAASLAPVPAAAPALGPDGRLRYERPGFVEWYANTVHGVEQHFTVAARPEGDGLLVLDGGVITDLAPTLRDDAQTLAFEGIESQALLTISTMVVYDATGQVLPSRMAWDGAVLRYEIDDQGAAYPLHIDPPVGTCPSSWCSDGDESTIDICQDDGSTCTNVFDDGYEGLACAWGAFCCADGSYHADCSDPSIPAGQDCPDSWCDDGDPGTDDSCGDFTPATGAFVCAHDFDSSLEGTPCDYGVNCCADGNYHADCDDPAVPGGQDCPDSWCNDAYLRELVAHTQRLGLEGQIRFAGDRFAHARGRTAGGERIYSLSDAYARAAACTYFSTYEGFGNAFVEAVLARRPIFVNNYEPVYWPDIGSLGFRTIQIEGGRLTDRAVDSMRAVLADPERASAMTEHNYALGRTHFSYEALERLLRDLFSD